jgi:hypothetical protein
MNVFGSCYAVKSLCNYSYPDAMRQGNVVRVLPSLNRRFTPDNNSLEHTAQISARLRLSSIFSGAQLAPR